MNLIIYPLLSAKSKKRITKKRRQFGRAYHYTPRRNLVYRLSRQLGLTPEQVREQIAKERDYLLKNSQYFVP